MEDQPKASEMTEFGKALWMLMQEKGPYNRSTFAELLGHKTGWKPSRQAVSNWLKGDRDVPRELVPATTKALNLDIATQRRLEHLYFYGQTLPGGLITERNIEEIKSVEEEWDRLDEEEERKQRGD